ncbi:S-formylglutathione hydrolase [Marinivivus vitaminiproducens]|uniref:S-formylglutathione hydrolase n=1 Tax=Marinivivus vitaminiproducens TaxID=3035935 RepID=UPI0027A414E4|nr:S-formylglutathione hydrolase [Geminicoccaceae bacterium SCSIO 64248]
METVSTTKSFGGTNGVYRHAAETTGCDMTFAVYTPPGKGPFPVLYYLSGLTCTHANVMEKGGAQGHASKHGVVLVMPDTSPRGVNLPGEDDAYDFGSGAGFYVNATRAPWSKHYRMYDYVTSELPALIEKEFPVDPERMGVFGHSMGGHGALITAFKNPHRYKSVSAFAPIVAPTRVPWGHKAFAGYLGDEDKEAWRAWDATELLPGSGWSSPILIDQGTSDNFLKEQLRPELFEEVAKTVDVPLTLRLQDGYDHSYYFISTFMGDHIDHHAALLKA